MPRKSSNPGQRKQSPTAGRKGKPWRDRARLDLLPLEAAVEKMVIQRTPIEVIAAWIRSQGTISVEVPGEDEAEVSRGPYADTTDEQVEAMVAAIKAKWRAVMDSPDMVAQAKAEHVAMIDAALHDAWNRPVFVMTEAGPMPLQNPDGTASVQPDHKAIAAYLKERRETIGLGAVQKHVHAHLHGNLPPPAAMSPADKEAEIQQLLERRAAALGPAAPAPPAAAMLPPGSVVIEATPAPRAKKKRA